MAYIDLIPTSVVSETWQNPLRAIIADSSYSSAQDTTKTLVAYNFSPALPKDIRIDGVQVIVTAKSIGGAGGISVSFGDSLTTQEYSTKTQALTTTNTTYTLGSSSDITDWGSVSYYKINKPYFCIQIKNTSANKAYVDAIVFRIYYTDTAFLTGTRSSFSSPTYVTDSIDPVANGKGIVHQVKADQLNTIGDCLLNIEKSLIYLPSVVPIFAASLQPAYLHTITVTGTITANTNGIFWERTKITSPVSYTGFNDSYGLSARNLSNVFCSVFPLAPLQFDCVDAIGWVTSGNALNYPVIVSPQSMYFQDVNGNYNYTIGFSLAQPNVFVPASGYNASVRANGSRFDGVQANSQTPFANLPLGTLTVKITGLTMIGDYNYI